MRNGRYNPRPVLQVDGEPFDTAEQAWMWSVQATVARHEGARVTAGQGEIPRPCEPADVMQVVARMNRERRLSDRHVSVLVRYGRRSAAPNARQYQEYRDARLWDEALDRLVPPLRGKGIIH